ncbi:hypothetical protein Mal4_46310 [Maioricimonas rarisocia]|uniref:Uncharacterized protein n=1 Tax=Maioricimonas rarisocia TaxID=2528026 RepID=A0A517ZCT4_9PLAN|nr:hypothetical protein [Maioricimonas rarisocia]QDU40275.1 hypothetical protein Mal4_46310 [Maioricimonas rarisocia]
MKVNSGKIWLAGATVLAVAVAPLLFGSGKATRALARSERRIASMTQPQRDRLERNFSEYRELTPQQREHYRQLHVALETDQSDNHGRIVRVMRDYYDWLKTLPAYQREQLRKTTDPDARLALARKYVEQQREREAEEEYGGEEMPVWLEGVPGMSEEDLETVFSMIVQRLPKTTDEEAELEALSGIERHLRALRMLIDRGRPVQQIVGLPELQQRLSDRLSDEELRAALDRTSDNRERTRVWMGALVKGLLREYRSEVQRRVPTDEKLRAFFDSDLTDEEQDALLQLEPEDFHAALVREYLGQYSRLDIGIVQRAIRPPADRGGDAQRRPSRGFMDRFFNGRTPPNRRENGPDGRPPRNNR